MSDDIVEKVAEELFKSVHGYHPDLNWRNAYDTHKDLYRRHAKIAYDTLHAYFCDPECVEDDD